jgi:hypothetical protein
MLVIRAAQVSVLERESSRRFDDWLAAELRAFAPSVCDQLGESGLRELVQLGRQRARAHGIEAPEEICKFTGLMIRFGRDFDRLRPWAQRALEAQPHPRSKLRHLVEAAMLHLSDSGGEP